MEIEEFNPKKAIKDMQKVDNEKIKKAVLDDIKNKFPGITNFSVSITRNGRIVVYGLIESQLAQLDHIRKH